MHGVKRTAFKPSTKPMRKRSPKRATYMASQARQDGLAHMGRVKGLSCAVCGCPPPSEAHHVTGDKEPRNDNRTIPLCIPCHLLYHARKRTWVAANGPDYEFLDRVNFLLYGD